MKPTVLVNRSSIPDNLVLKAIRFTRPRGASPSVFLVRQSDFWTNANAYHYDASRGQFLRSGMSTKTLRRRSGTDAVEAKIPGDFEPCVYHHSRSGADIPMGSRLDVLVYELAHEQRHAWQSVRPRGKGWLCRMADLRGRLLRGSRGDRFARLAELDADRWALRKLDEWRKWLYEGYELWTVGIISGEGR